jgi:hypothetical protein
MHKKKMATDRYFQQLRVLGAWWRLGSSALEPQLLAESAALDGFDPAETELAAHGGVDLSI